MKERYDYMDWLRVLAIFSVVGIHVVAQHVTNFNHAPNVWWYGNLIDSALRVSVPIFFMISGALLLTRTKEETLSVFFKKRFSKVIIPLVVWSIIYLIYRQVMWFEDFTWKQMLKMMLTDNVFFHLWFLYAIIGLYLMTPFLQKIVQHSSKQLLQYFLVSWFFLSSLAPFVYKFEGFSIELKAGLFGTYIGYFILGAYLLKYPLPKKSLPYLGVLALIGYGVTVYGTYLLTLKNDGKLDGFFYQYVSPNVVVIGIFLFVLFQQYSHLFKSNKVIQLLSAASMGIYLIHPIVQLYGRRIGFDEYWVHPVIAVPLVWISIFIASFILTWIIQKIPVVKRIVP